MGSAIAVALVSPSTGEDIALPDEGTDEEQAEQES